jgi:hypothetical protein
MSAATLIREAEAAGVELRVENGKVKASGDRAAVAEMLDQLRDHKEEIVALLAEAHATTNQLVAAAMRCCDFYNDTEDARDEMRLACREIPQHLRFDLFDHFRKTYPNG